MYVREASRHPPALDGGGDAQGEEIPWVLLEEFAYVADRRNATTAYARTRLGAHLQVTLCFARPPRVSYVCVYHHGDAGSNGNAKEEEEAIFCDPSVLSTDANLVLLSISLGPSRDSYIYRPAGDRGPSLTLLPQPPCDRINTTQIGVLSWHTIHRDDDGDGSSGLPLLRLRAHRGHQGAPPYMVAALSYTDYGVHEPGHKLYVYDSRLGCWNTHTVSVDEQHSQQYGGEKGHILHQTCKVLSIGGKHGTMGFVDLWRVILLCDLLLLKDNPTLGYIRLPPPLLPDGFTELDDDARLHRDIAVIEDRIVYVEQDFHLLKSSPKYHCIEDGWVAATWSMLITSPVGGPWEKHHEVDSSNLDITTPQFDLLPKVHDGQGRPFPPFKRLTVVHPTLSLSVADATTVCLMVKKHIDDAKAWVIAVDMPNNKLGAVFEFDAERSARMGFVYMHSGISRYVKGPSGTKGNQKRPGGMLLVGASNRKQPRMLKLVEMSSGGTEGNEDLEMEEGEDGDDDMLVDLVPS